MTPNSADNTPGTTSEPPAAVALWPSGDPYEVAPLDLVDVAVGKPASQSSTSQWSREDDAAGAVSGVLAEDFAFHTDAETNPWWQVDLRWEYPLHEIIVFNRQKRCAERARSLGIAVSLDLKSWTTLHEGTVFFAGTMPFVLPLAGQVRARFVRLALRDHTFLHLAQVKVHVERRHLPMVEVDLVINAAPAAGAAARLAITGTSNAVARFGYAREIAASPYAQVCASAALGSSHAVMVPYRLGDLSWR